jgi:predicted kinase
VTAEPRDRGRLILICGLPGAGKTTLANELVVRLAAVRLCPDEWLSDMGIDLYEDTPRAALEARFKQLAYRLVTSGLTVILEFGFWVRSERDEIRDQARSLGAWSELRYLAVPLDELWRRIESRNQTAMWRHHPVTRAHLDEWATRFEPPTDEELGRFDRPST